jgi:polysaccharide deacetylase family protein (PEP-CTERM system associated)
LNAVTLPIEAEVHGNLGGAIVNGLSVDVEDWFQVGAFESVIERDDWNSLSDRVERNVREIVARGHELASHGWDHGRVFRMDRQTFAADISRARKVLEDASGVPILGYRAPSFSIDHRTPWAFMELVEQGYTYSSSVAPVTHDHYGWEDAPRFAFRPLPWAGLVEIPVTTAMFAGKRLAAGGGGFFRVIPYGFTRWAIRQVNAREGRPAVFYFHPWEIDPGQPRVAGAPLKSRLRHYTNLDKMAGKLRQLVGEFAWGRMDLLAHREAARLDGEAAV